LATLAQNHDVEFQWLPYELRPEPVPLPDMTGDNLVQAEARWNRGVAPLSQRYGIHMRFPHTKPRSRFAHEAAEFARDQGKFDEMKEAIFRAFFVGDRDIGEVDVLLDAAESIGLDRAALAESLATRQYQSRVDALEGVSANFGIRAVPTIIVGNLAVEGAQPYEVLRQVLDQALAGV
jgi:predicted DsbA family dithiol-disulfide isomerase